MDRFTLEHLKEGECVVYGYSTITKLPSLAILQKISAPDKFLTVLQLNVHRFDVCSHSYLTSTSEEKLEFMVSQLKLQQSFPIYNNHVRLPCAF